MRRALALSIPFLVLAVACTYDNGDGRRFAIAPDDSDTACGTQEQPTIDVDRMIEVDAGQGAGIYLEYGAGGHWHVRTSCDTDNPHSARRAESKNASCDWDVLVYASDGHALSNFAAEDLESSDSLHPYLDSPGAYQLNAETDSDIDGFTFDGDPGASVTVDALLESSCALHYFFWVGDGALHSGTPSNPLTLVPSGN